MIDDARRGKAGEHKHRGGKEHGEEQSVAALGPRTTRRPWAAAAHEAGRSIVNGRAAAGGNLLQLGGGFADLHQAEAVHQHFSERQNVTRRRFR